MLANVYLHYALDIWIEKSVMPKLKGWAKYVRYADDFLMVFQYEEDAVSVMNVLPGQLGKFNLEVAPEKTRVLPYGKTTAITTILTSADYHSTRPKLARVVSEWESEQVARS